MLVTDQALRLQAWSVIHVPISCDAGCLCSRHQGLVERIQLLRGGEGIGGTNAPCPSILMLSAPEGSSLHARAMAEPHQQWSRSTLQPCGCPGCPLCRHSPGCGHRGQSLVGGWAPQQGKPGVVQVLQLQAGLHEAHDRHRVLAHGQQALGLLEVLLPDAVRLQQRHAPACRHRTLGLNTSRCSRSKDADACEHGTLACLIWCHPAPALAHAQAWISQRKL